MKSTLSLFLTLLLAALPLSTGICQVNSNENNALPFTVNNVEYMRISGTAGYVGIGTTGPAYPFDVSSSGSGGRFYSSNTTLSYLDVQNTGTATNAGSILRLISKNAAKSADNTVDFVKYQGGAFYINHNETNAAASMNFGVGGSARMTIDSAGDVGIGATNPLAKLDVNGTISASDAIQVGTSSLTCTASVPGAIRYNSGNIQFCNGTSWATVGTSTAPGSSGDIVFNNGSGFAADTGQLYWDATNNRLGIGTSGPGAPLTVRGTGTISVSGSLAGLDFYDRSVGTGVSALYRTGNVTSLWDSTGGNRLSIDNGTGNVGIGNGSPQATLQVSGSFVVSTSAQAYTSPSLYVDTIGRTAIGTNVPSALFSVVSYTAGLASSNGIYVRLDQNPASTPNAHYRGLYVINDYTSSQNATSANSIRGGEFLARSLGTGNVSYTYGLLTYGQASGGNSVYGNTALYALSSVSNSTASTYLFGAQLYTYDYNGPGVGGVTSAFGAQINGYSNAGRMTNYYGLYVNSFSGIDPSGDFYGLYVADAAMNNYFAGNVGIGTPIIPHGGIGYAKFAMDGTAGSGAGPHTQYTVSTDDYPVFQQLNWTHDNIALNFDAYYDGSWRSSDPGSNFQIYKVGDVLKLTYDSSIAAGSAVTWNDGIVLNTSGNVGIGAAPSSKLHVNGGRTQIGSTATNYASTGFDWNFNLLIDALDTSSIGFHDAGNTVGMISFQGGTFKIGADAGWGNATVIAAPPMMILAEEQAATVDAGTCTSGSWFTRVLNTTRANTISGASLSSNQFTLPAGDFIIRASSPGFNTDRHQARLYNVTDAAAHTYGSNAYSGSAASYSPERSDIIAKVSITASKAFRIEFRCQTSQATNGLGIAGDWGTEVYTLVEITQIK